MASQRVPTKGPGAQPKPPLPPVLEKKPMRDWTLEDVSTFLETLRLKFGERCSEYKRLFFDNDIDGEILMELSEQLLTSIGMRSYGHRHYLLKTIRGVLQSASSFSLMPAMQEHVQPQQVGAAVERTGNSAFYQGLSLSRPTHSFSPQSGGSCPSTKGGSGMSASSHSVQKPVDGKDAASSNMGTDRSSHVGTMWPAVPCTRKPAPRIHESQIAFGRKIGCGSVGYVFEGRFERHPVAVKKHRLDGSSLQPQALREFENEVGKMTLVNHPCTVRCFGMLEPTPGIVMELVQGESLFQILHSGQSETFDIYSIRLPWTMRVRFLLDGLYGLRAIHAAGIIHGDYKSLNLLVGIDGRVKVADFGLSKVLDFISEHPGTKAITGTPQYMAPEVMLSEPHDNRADIYSLGIVLWEVLTGRIPWKGMDIVHIIQQVTQEINLKEAVPSGRPEISTAHAEHAPRGYIELMQEAWAQRPQNRPSLDRCVKELEKINMLQIAGAGTCISAARHSQRRGSHEGSTLLGETSVKRARSSVDGGADSKPDGRQSMQGDVVERSMLPPRPHNLASIPAPGTGGSTEPVFCAAGGMNLLHDMLKMADQNAKKQAVAAMAKACVDNSQNQVLLARSGAIKTLIESLSWETDSVFKSHALAALAAACSQSSQNRQYVCRSGGIAVVTSLFSHPDAVVQENAAKSLAVLIKRHPTEDAQHPGSFDSGSDVPLMPRVGSGGLGSFSTSSPLDLKPDDRVGWVAKLVVLLKSSAAIRVREASASALANAMMDDRLSREIFKKEGGVAPMLELLRVGDRSAKQSATTALWNAMVDNDLVGADIISQGGICLFTQQLDCDSVIVQELAASSIWKLCAQDAAAVRDELLAAIGPLVSLIRSGVSKLQLQAAGAIRSACIASVPTKQALNRAGGISALVHLARSATPCVQEQALAALANACANFPENQNAAREAGAVPLLVDLLRVRGANASELIVCATAAIRNLCVKSPETQEALHRCGGVEQLLRLLYEEASPQLMEYTLGALWKACTCCEANRAMVLANGLDVIDQIMDREDAASETRRCGLGLLKLFREDDGAAPRARQSEQGDGSRSDSQLLEWGIQNQGIKLAGGGGANAHMASSAPARAAHYDAEFISAWLEAAATGRAECGRTSSPGKMPVQGADGVSGIPPLGGAPLQARPEGAQSAPSSARAGEGSTLLTGFAAAVADDAPERVGGTFPRLCVSGTPRDR